MAIRRVAIVVTGLLLAIVTPACKFSRATNTAADKSATTESTVEVFGDLTTIPDDTTTTAATDANTTTSRHVATTVRASVTTAKPAPRVATTARPATVPTSPHCNVSVPDSYYGGDWTATVTSTFPNSNVTVTLNWKGGQGGYSGVTDGSGTWVKTQRVQPSMRGQRISVSTAVGGRTCSTSFTVS